MKTTTILLAALLLASCSGGEGSKCGKNADCGQGLACASPRVAERAGIEPYTCQSPEGVEAARVAKREANSAEILRRYREKEAARQ